MSLLVTMIYVTVYSYMVHLAMVFGDFGFYCTPTLLISICIMKHMKQCILNIAVFAKLKCLPVCIMAHFAKLIAHQTYRIYSI